MFLLGSAYPTGKLGLNASIPPILFGAIRMGIVFIFLLPFCKIEIPNKKHILHLFKQLFIVSSSMFILIPILLRQNINFWYCLILGCILTIILYLSY